MVGLIDKKITLDYGKIAFAGQYYAVYSYVMKNLTGILYGC